MNKPGHIKLISFLLLAYFAALIPQASAQSWLWGRQAGTGLVGYAVTTDPSGNIYCAGYNGLSAAVSFGTFTLPGYLGQGIWAKYDPSGNLLWASGTTLGTAEIGNITTDPSGNLIIFGKFGTPTIQIGAFTLANIYYGTGSSQYFLAKVSPAGTVLWAIKDGNDEHNPGSIGGGMTTIGGVVTDAAGNIFITGSFFTSNMSIGGITFTNNGPAYTADIFVAKYTSSGSLVWASSIGGSANDYGMCITVTPSGFIYVAGDMYSPSMTVGSSVLLNPHPRSTISYYAYIAKFSPAGAPLWGEDAGGTGGAYALSLASDNCDNVYMIGGFGDTSITFGGTTITRTYPATANGLLVMALYLVQYSPADVVTWSKTIGAPTTTVRGYSIAVPSCGQIWVNGNYSEPVVIAPGDTLAVVPGGYDPAFIAGYNLSGSVAGYAGLACGGASQMDIACNSTGDIYMSGFSRIFAANPYYVIGPDTVNESFFLGKLSNSLPGTDSAYASHDTAFCAAALTLNAPPGYCSYLWNNDSTSSSINVAGPGKYFVYCVACGNVLVDTFNVSIAIQDTTYKETDTGICATSVTKTLSAPPGYSYYLWSTGATSDSISITTAGAYYVTAISGCGMTVDTFKVSLIPAPIINLGKDTSFCTGNPLTLYSPQPGGTSYLWSTGSTSGSILVSNPGIYWLKVTNFSGCTFMDTITVKLSLPSSTGHLTNVTPEETITYGSDIQLNADNEWLYVWRPNDGSLNDPNINDPVATPLHTTLYTVYGYDHQGCMDSATVVINVDSTMKECVPNSFTPNGDGLNDVFMPICVRFQKMVDLRIYNRWGQMVFFSTSMESGWDGTFNGVPQDMDTYFYMITIARPGGNVIYKGDVTLIR